MLKENELYKNYHERYADCLYDEANNIDPRAVLDAYRRITEPEKCPEWLTAIAGRTDDVDDLRYALCMIIEKRIRVLDKSAEDAAGTAKIYEAREAGRLAGVLFACAGIVVK